MSRDVVVVGAGPAGLTTALLLGALGLRPLILEAMQPGDAIAGSRALFVHHDSLVLLESARPGLGQAIGSFGLRWDRRETWYRGRCVYRRDEPTPQGSQGLPPYTSLRQIATVKMLREACTASGLDITWGAEVRRVTPAPGGVLLETTAGNFSAGFVVGADGARSVIRAGIGAKLEGPRLDGHHVVVDLMGPATRTRQLHYRCPELDGRTVLLIPFRGGLQVDVQCADGDDAARTAECTDRLADLAAKLAPGTTAAVDWVARYRFTRAVASSFTDVHRRVMLVGEAAHLFPPFGARGMNSAFADASAAAMAIALSAGRGPSAAVAAFATDRRRAALLNAEAAHAAFTHLHPRPLQRVRQDVAAAVSSLSPATSSWLEKAAYGPRVRTGGRY